MSESIVSTPHQDGGIAPKRVQVVYGFWLFLISDIILFSSLFATYGVLRGSTNGGPTEAELFDLNHVALETGLLLLSSFTCGMITIAATAKNQRWTQIALTLTILLGAGFIFLEVQEFAEMVRKGASPQRSAFLSAFYALVGCHGIHVSFGIFWAFILKLMFWKKGFQEGVKRKLMCFSLFWHALDLVWIGVFTVVYLIGSIA